MTGWSCSAAIMMAPAGSVSPGTRSHRRVTDRPSARRLYGFCMVRDLGGTQGHQPIDLRSAGCFQHATRICSPTVRSRSCMAVPMLRRIFLLGRQLWPCERSARANSGLLQSKTNAGRGGMPDLKFCHGSIGEAIDEMNSRPSNSGLVSEMSSPTARRATGSASQQGRQPHQH